MVDRAKRVIYGDVGKKGCRSCLMLFCVPCQHLNERGRNYGVHHCEKHCRHKKERGQIKIAAGIA